MKKKLHSITMFDTHDKKALSHIRKYCRLHQIHIHPNNSQIKRMMMLDVLAGGGLDAWETIIDLRHYLEKVLFIQFQDQDGAEPYRYTIQGQNTLSDLLIAIKRLKSQTNIPTNFKRGKM